MDSSNNQAPLVQPVPPSEPGVAGAVCWCRNGWLYLAERREWRPCQRCNPGGLSADYVRRLAGW